MGEEYCEKRLCASLSSSTPCSESPPYTQNSNQVSQSFHKRRKYQRRNSVVKSMIFSSVSKAQAELHSSSFEESASKDLAQCNVEGANKSPKGKVNLNELNHKLENATLEKHYKTTKTSKSAKNYGARSA